MTGTPFVDIGNLIISTLGSLYLAAILLRFLFQVVRADFYNPISQTIVKATNPVLMPLRKVVPGVFGIDVASLVLAVIFHTLIIFVLGFIHGVGLINPLSAVIWAALGNLYLVAEMFFWGMLITIVTSFLAPHSNHPALALLRQLIEPILAPFRRLLPPMGGIDLSPILAFLTLRVITMLLTYPAAMTYLQPDLVLGF